MHDVRRAVAGKVGPGAVLVVVACAAALASACVSGGAARPTTVAPQTAASTPLAGPAAPTGPSTPEALGPKLPSFLAEREDFGSTTRVIRIGRVRTAPDGPWLGDGEGVDAELDVPVVSAGQDVGIVYPHRDYSLRLFVSREDLAVRLREDTALAVAPGETPTPGGAARLVSGTDVAHVAVEGEDELIAYEEYGVRVAGWVPTSAFDHVVRTSRDFKDVRSGDLAIIEPVEVVDAPGGSAIARLSVDASVMVQARGEPVDGYQPVTIVGDRVLVEGFVPTAAVRESLGLRGYGTSSRCGGLATGHGPHEVLLRAGAPLHTRADGPVAGALVRDAYHKVTGRAPGWLEVELWTPWTELRLWVPVASVVTAP